MNRPARVPVLGTYRTRRLALTSVAALAFAMSTVAVPSRARAAPSAPVAPGAAASSNPFYQFDIVAQAGQDDLVSPISTGVSINEDGFVALVSKNTSGGEGIYIVGPAAPFAPRNINPATSGTSTRTFGGAAQIADVINQIVARDRKSGAPASTFLRLWDGNGTDVYTLVASAPAPAFDEILAFPSASNLGQVVFSALKGPDSFLMTPDPLNPGTYHQVPVETPLRPMIADDGSIVVRAGLDPAEDVVRYDYNLSTPLVIAGGANGFTATGRAPGVSDTGQIVAFRGDRGNGTGIFASVDVGGGARQLVTVAGEAWNGTSCARPELGFDAAGTNLCFKDFGDALSTNRVAVTHYLLGPPGIEGDSLVFAFVGTPSAASRANPALPAQPFFFSGQRGIWTVRVDAERELGGAHNLVFHPRRPTRVVQVGDVVGGATINDFALYDPVANAPRAIGGGATTQRLGDHRIAFWASTSLGEMVIRGTHLDSDEDGLLDHWETGGIDMDGDGVLDLNLAEMDANPLVRDIFLELDWLVPRNEPGNIHHIFQPAAYVTQALASMFGQAPALSNGVPAAIVLHVDAGPGDSADGAAPLSVNMGTATLVGGNEIGMPADPTLPPDVVYFGLPGAVTAAGVRTRDLQGIKDELLSTAGLFNAGARELVFHYAVLAESFAIVCTDGTKSSDKDGGGCPAPGPFVGTVKSATQSTLTSDAQLPRAAGKLYGDLVKITSGAGAGQIFEITGNTESELTIGEIDAFSGTAVPATWDTQPAPGDSFVLLAGDAGFGETNWGAGDDRHGIPGNDLIVSLRGFGIAHQPDWLSNQCIQWRTLAHEVGHNLGLRHDGDDFGEDAPTYKSLMSYDWDHDCPTPPVEPSKVQGFGQKKDPVTGDVVFDDWSSLKLDFQGSAIFLGNSFYKGGGAQTVVEREPTYADYQEIYGRPIDLVGPAVTIDSPVEGSSVVIGTDLTVQLTATDNLGIRSVHVSFDVDGDGSTTGTGEMVEATPTGPTTYEASFAGVSGGTGDRVITAVAEDGGGTTASATRTVIVVSDACAQGIEPGITIGDASITEGTGTDPVAAFDLALDCRSAQDVSFSYATADGTAGSADYQAASGTSTIPAGDLAGTIEVTVTGDALDEAAETFTVVLDDAVGGSIVDGQATGTILDDDPVPTVSIADVSVTEGDSSSVAAELLVQLSAASGREVRVRYTTRDGTALQGSDYTMKAGVLRFPPGTTTLTVTIEVLGDTAPEADERFYVGLYRPRNVALGDRSAIVTILDNDAPRAGGRGGREP